LVHPCYPIFSLGVFFYPYYLLLSSWFIPVGLFWYHLLQPIGAMDNFDDINQVHELDLDPEVDIDHEIVFTSSGSLTYLVDRVMTSERFALLVLFAMYGVADIDDFMSFIYIDFKQT
jgi:hypothetical protein